MHWFETELLTREENLVGLMAVNRDVIGQAETLDRSDRIVLDMDSSESPVHGQQEGGAYNGHFDTVCYHPLFLFNDHGDCLAAKVRPGNVSSADDWEELLVPKIDRQQAEGVARQIIESKEQAECARLVPGDTHRDLQVSTALDEVAARLLYLPFWLAAFAYKGDVYRFVVNGQTGKVTGEAPVSYLKIAMVVGAVVLAILVIVAIVSMAK